MTQRQAFLGGLQVILALVISTRVVQRSLAQEWLTAQSYVRQLKVTPEDQLRGYQSFMKDLERLDGRGLRPGDFTDAAAQGGGIHQKLKNPPEKHSADKVLDHRLNVEYGENLIYNVLEGKDLKVCLRSYNGQLFGQTLRIKPGDLLKILVDNQLPPDKPHHGSINIPHRFNTTNLHTHGLHVSPSGNSDNVLIAVPPNTSFQNEIYIPSDHAAGTFWYHAHVHGSTAIQTTSGMAGALIVEGGLDEVPAVRDAYERIMIFQQMPYVESQQTSGLYKIEGYEHFGPNMWDLGVNERGWRTTINGQTHPIITMRPREVQRWRMIHAGLRETIDVSVVPYDQTLGMMRQFTSKLEQQSKASDAESLKDTRRDAVEGRRRVVLQQAVRLSEIAADGLAYGFAWPRESIELQPGYRSDILVKIEEPGLYVVVDNELSAENALWRRYESPKVLGFVLVAGQPNNMQLPTNDQLACLRPHASISDDEVTEHIHAPSGQPTTRRRLQKVEFNIDLDFDPPLFQINSQSYNPNAIPRTLGVGTAHEWILTSRFVNHPFHIHVNPFEITEWNDEGGNSRLPNIDGQTRTIWKDTIIVQENQVVRMRSRNERYIGRYVLHCHILDHEDQGMMQDVEIAPSGSAHH